MPITLPPLLVGPQLRRVTKSEVTVWMLLSSPCTAKLTIYKGLVEHSGGAGAFFSTDVQPQTDTTTKAFSLTANLHLAVMHAALPAVLEKGALYSYNVTLGGEMSTTDLRSLGMLEDRPSVGVNGLPQLALGYKPGRLPSFVWAPNVPELRIAHASCRKANGFGGDALARIDQQIGDFVANPLLRPHQLFLTGDQIYADDVPLALSPIVSTLGAKLVSGDAASETVPVRINGKVEYLTIDQRTFPGGARHRLTQRALSSTEADCHLVSFGDYAAMYVLAWSPSCWPLIPLCRSLSDFKQSRPVPSTDLDRIGNDPLQGKYPLPSDEDYQSMFVRANGYRLGVPRVARALANVPTFMIMDDHEVTDDWNRSPGWQTRAYGPEDPDRSPQPAIGHTIVRNGLIAYSFFQDTGNDPAAYVMPADPSRPKSMMLLRAMSMLGPGVAPEIAHAFGDEIDALLGIGVGMLPKVTFDYRVPGEQHDVFVMDTRTCRRYRSSSAIVPYLMSPATMDRQLAGIGDPAAEDRLAVIVSAGNVIGDIRLGWIQRTGGITDNLANVFDRENWDEEPTSVAHLLRRVSHRRRVVILSGDVHHSFASPIDYYEKDRKRTIVQFVCSASRNWEFSKRLIQNINSVSSTITGASRAATGWYEARRDELGFAWWDDSAQALATVGTRGLPYGLERYSREAGVGSGWSSTDAELAKSWPPTLPKPTAYWRVRQHTNNGVRRSMVDISLLNAGVSSTFFWRNSVGLVTFLPDGMRTQQMLLAAPADLERADVDSVMFDVAFDVGDDPLGFGW